MTQPVTLENEHLKLQVWPQIGAKVSSLVDKADHFDLLFTYPAEIPFESCLYDRPYASGWYAGWDEVFPAVAPSRYSGHPYDGIAVPDHGELWALPTTAVPTRDGITTVWDGLRFGYRFTRNLYLEGPSVVAEYTLANLAPCEFRFVWASHPLMSMAAPVELDLPAGAPFRFSHDAFGHEIDQPFAWPTTPRGDDLSRPAELVSKYGWKVFSANPIEGPVVVRYPARGRRVTVEYASADAMPAYWGIWVNTGGWGTHRHFAIEPTTGRYDQIDRSIKDQSAGHVAALGKRVWATRLTVGA